MPGKYRNRGGMRRRRRNFGKGKPQQVQVNSLTKVKKYAGWVPWLLKNAMYVKKLVNAELKYQDVYTSSTVDNVGFISYISAIAEGSDTFERNGRSIRPVYWHCNCDITKNATPASTFIRVIVFQDTECQASTPLITDVLVSTSVNSQYNLATSKGRFVVIYDNLINLDAVNYTRALKHTAKIQRHIFYDGTGSTTASAGKNALFALYLSDQGAANAPQVNMRHRIRYYDN